MSGAAWAGFLDSLESELHAVERTARGRARRQRPFEPPADLGPLPRELADRARSILAEVGRVAATVSAEMTRTAAQLDERRAMDPRGPRSARNFDSKA